MLIPNLSVLLAERRLTISKVSQDTGLSRTTLTALASRSAKGIQLDTLNTLCQYLKVGPEALFIYRPFDLALESGGQPGRSLVTFTVTRVGAAPSRCALACDAEYRFSPENPAVLEELRVRLSLPESGDPVQARRSAELLTLLRALPPSVLADIERDLLARFDGHISPDLAPADYSPTLAWPWE